MTDTITLAKQAGLAPLSGGILEESLERFAQLIRADERESCAMVCINMQAGWNSDDQIECASAIRARGTT